MKAKSLLGLLGLGALLGICGCGQNTGLTLQILTPPDSDPFSEAATVVLTVQGTMMTAQQTTAAVTGGKFSTSLEITSPARDNYVYVSVEAFNGSNQVVGRGRTPNFILPQSDTNVTVYVGRPGLVTTTQVKLPDDNGSQGTPVGRKFLAGTSLRGRHASPSSEPSLGVLIVGGLNDIPQPTAHAWRYSPVLHNLVDAGALPAPRHGAVLVPSADDQQGQQALLWGGADASNKMLTTAEKFDPAVSDLSMLWAAPAADVANPGDPGAYAPAVVEVKDNTFLISGGSSQPTDGMPLAQAVLAVRTPGSSSDMPAKLGAVRLPPAAEGNGKGPMVARRFEHSATAVTWLDGSGALLFGGLSLADIAGAAPVAELFRVDKNTFEAFSLQPAQPSRKGHAAVALPSGKVLIVGGYEEDMATLHKTALGSALLIDPSSHMVELRENFLMTPRYAASINRLTKEILVCGGYNSDGAVLDNCEIFNPDDGLNRIGPPIPLIHPRAGHLALPLETDQLLLVGGVGAGNKAQADIDIYTAR